MGVDGLYKFINKKFPEIFSIISINDIKGQPCIIDGMQHIYNQLIYMRSKNKEVLTSTGKNVSHIHGLINSITYYLKNGIIPIMIFDGKSPDIKRKKIEERRSTLKENLKKLKCLEKEKIVLADLISKLENVPKTIEELFDENTDSGENIDNTDDIDNLIFGTPPDLSSLEDNINKMNNIQEEYKKIYKKSIILKDYYVGDWIMILELLGLPIIKAKGEADPLCAHISKNSSCIYGIISDDSDMLVFGAPLIMRKYYNQKYSIIKLKDLLSKITNLINKELGKNICFTQENLIEFSILLGTDYGTFKLNKHLNDPYEILKYYTNNNFEIDKIISEEQVELFGLIKEYYMTENFKEEVDKLFSRCIWEKPNLQELKQKLLSLDVDEDFIDKNNETISNYYNKFLKCNGQFKKSHEKQSDDNIVNNIINNTDNLDKNKIQSNSIQQSQCIPIGYTGPYNYACYQYAYNPYHLGNYYQNPNYYSSYINHNNYNNSFQYSNTYNHFASLNQYNNQVQSNSQIKNNKNNKNNYPNYNYNSFDKNNSTPTSFIINNIDIEEDNSSNKEKINKSLKNNKSIKDNKVDSDNNK